METKIHEVLKEATQGRITEEELEEFLGFYKKLPYVENVQRDHVLMVFAFYALSKLQYKKEQTYGNSWEKRGEMGVFFNVARKFDRVESMTLYEAKDAVGESKMDTIGDLAVYSLLWLTYSLRKDPEEFYSWLSQF